MNEDKCLSELSLLELFEYRKWLSFVSDAGTVVHNRKIVDITMDVDKEIWHRMVDDNSPWEKVKRYSKDD